MLTTVKEAIDAGGAGIAFGRNIWQHKDPEGLLKAISEIVHQGAAPEEAIRLIRA